MSGSPSRISTLSHSPLILSSKGELALPENSDCALGATVMPAKAGIQAGRLRGCLVDSRFRGHDEFGTQLSSWAEPGELVEGTSTAESLRVI
jgi:hypothetical protein